MEPEAKTDKPRVEITRYMLGICHMQVCAAKDASDEEILEACNRDNPSGTSLGWSNVVRKDDDLPKTFRNPGATYAPVPCRDDPSRLHFLVGC